MYKVKRYYTCNGTNEIRDGYTGASRLSVGWLVCRFKVSSQTTPTFPHFSKFSCIPISCDKANDNEREEENKANDNEREEENKAGITNEKKKTKRGWLKYLSQSELALVLIDSYHVLYITFIPPMGSTVFKHVLNSSNTELLGVWVPVTYLP